MQSILEKWKNADLFCKISAIAGVTAIPPVLTALWLHRSGAVICALLQTACVIFAILIHLGKLEVKKKFIKFVLLILAAVLLFAGIMSLLPQGSAPHKAETAEEAKLKEYTASIYIDFESNILFNTYDVELSVDGRNEASLKHGEDISLELSLTEGKHSIEFASAKDMSITGKSGFDIDGDIFLMLGISCHKDSIEVVKEKLISSSSLNENETICTFDRYSLLNGTAQEISERLKAHGFSDITLSPIYDCDASSSDIGSVSDVLINGSSSYSPGNILRKDAEIIISYHESREADPEVIKAAEVLEALGQYLPMESAKRAVITAMTNCQATDVFSSDGNSYDPSRFHSYSDISGFFCTLEYEGTWTAMNETTWLVSGLILKIHDYDTYMRVDAQVTRDAESFILTSVDRIIGNRDAAFNNDSSVYGIEHMEPSEFNSFLTVPEALITEDRDTAELQRIEDEDAEKKRAEQAEKEAEASRKSWISSQFSIWDGRHTALTKLIKKNINDERSFDYVSADYVDITSEAVASEVNKILKECGFSGRVSSGDLLVYETFTAKNAFNATIKSTAYAIVKSDESITLLGFI